MFGRLRVSSCSLSEEIQTSYKADFCSLCHSLRSEEGYLSTLLTNYDNTFWLTVATGLGRQPAQVVRKPCTAVPFRSVSVRQHGEEISRSNLALLWMLVRAKAEDDSQDEGSWKAKAALKLAAGKAEKGEQYLAELGYRVESLSELPQRQRAVETRAGVSFQEVCEPTQSMMAEAFGHLAKVCDRPEKREELREFGRALGASIYLLDALEDHVEDLKAQRFNPLFSCPDVMTRSAVSALAQSWSDRLQGSAQRLELEGTSATVVLSAVARLRGRIARHSLLAEPRAASAPASLRRRDQAAFCAVLPGDDPGKEKGRECCCSNCDCEPCECCCEAPDCCESCGGCNCECADCSGCGDCSGCDCSGCDCGGCDCGGCSCSAWLPSRIWKRFASKA